MEGLVWIVWDIGAVVILAWCIRVCTGRGLLRTVVGFFSYIIAAFLANLFNGRLALFLYDNVARDILEVSVSNSIEKALAEGTTLLDTAPSFLLRLAETALQQEAGTLALDSAHLVDVIIDEALRGPVISMLEGASFLLLFYIGIFLVRRMARLFTGVNRIPVVGTVNAVLGGILGAMQGVAFLLIGAVIIHLVITLCGDSLWWLNTQVMNQTYVWRYFFRLAGGI